MLDSLQVSKTECDLSGVRNGHRDTPESASIEEEPWSAVVQDLAISANKKDAAPFTDKTEKALMKDADLYPPIKNADGSTTYSIILAGITDRSSSAGADYYSRKIDVTVPAGKLDLDDCSFIIGKREIIPEEKYTQLLKRDRVGAEELDLFTHGVSCTQDCADKQAVMLELTNGRPTVNIDWSSSSPQSNPIKGIASYFQDTAAALRANNNKAFESAIDNTIDHIGAEHTNMIGFSHGAMFDTRYLKHRVEDHLPRLDTLILTHPDVPVSAPELYPGNKPALLRDSADRSFVIGSRIDVLLKLGAVAGCIPGGTTFENGGSEERLGNNSAKSRSLIELEGAGAISESDDMSIGTHHFLNFAGINELLESQNRSIKDVQGDYDRASDVQRHSH